MQDITDNMTDAELQDYIQEGEDELAHCLEAEALEEAYQAWTLAEVQLACYG